MTTCFSTRSDVLLFADINISQQNAVESRFFKPQFWGKGDCFEFSRYSKTFGRQGVEEQCLTGEEKSVFGSNYHRVTLNQAFET